MTHTEMGRRGRRAKEDSFSAASITPRQDSNVPTKSSPVARARWIPWYQLGLDKKVDRSVNLFACHLSSVLLITPLRMHRMIFGIATLKGLAQVGG